MDRSGRCKVMACAESAIRFVRPEENTATAIHMAVAAIVVGNPQGRHPNEPGARGLYLVEVGDAGQVRRDFRAVDVVR